jgi:hypothetical protein
MKKLVVATVLSASVIVGMGSSVFAGEITGSGKGGPNHDGTPGGIGRAASACVFSGLEDGAGVPGTVQNWGHVADDPVFVEIVSSKGASEVTVWVDFGGGPFLVTIGCNPHAGGE